MIQNQVKFYKNNKNNEFFYLFVLEENIVNIYYKKNFENKNPPK